MGHPIYRWIHIGVNFVKHHCVDPHMRSQIRYSFPPATFQTATGSARAAIKSGPGEGPILGLGRPYYRIELMCM